MIKTLYRDTLFIMLLAFVVMVVWMLPFIKEAKKAENEGDPPPGNIIAAIVWPAGNTDIDLWVYGPGEPAPIGYSNKGGVLWNLLRDDLGTAPDLTPLNFESAYTRGTPAGEYIVNVHCYRCPVLPQKISVEIRSSASDGGGKGTKVLLTSSVELKLNGQERTAARFTLDKGGNIVPGSINFVFKELRAAQKFDSPPWGLQR